MQISAKIPGLTLKCLAGFLNIFICHLFCGIELPKVTRNQGFAIGDWMTIKVPSSPSYPAKVRLYLVVLGEICKPETLSVQNKFSMTLKRSGRSVMVAAANFQFHKIGIFSVHRISIRSELKCGHFWVTARRTNKCADYFVGVTVFFIRNI